VCVCVRVHFLSVTNTAGDFSCVEASEYLYHTF